MKPTPGPWSYDPETEKVTAGARGVIARVEPDSGPLVAAAPEMFTALNAWGTWAINAYDFGNLGGADRAALRALIEQTRAALAKAEGDS